MYHFITGDVSYMMKMLLLQVHASGYCKIFANVIHGKLTTKCCREASGRERNLREEVSSDFSISSLFSISVIVNIRQQSCSNNSVVQ